MLWVGVSTVFLNLGSSWSILWIFSTAWSADGVVLAAEGSADLGKGGVSEVAGEVHRDLAGEGDGLGAVLCAHVGELNGEELAHLALDVFDRDDLFRPRLRGPRRTPPPPFTDFVLRFTRHLQGAILLPHATPDE
jgi:hypothetical protein